MCHIYDVPDNEALSNLGKKSLPHAATTYISSAECSIMCEKKGRFSSSPYPHVVWQKVFVCTTTCRRRNFTSSLKGFLCVINLILNMRMLR